MLLFTVNSKRKPISLKEMKESQKELEDDQKVHLAKKAEKFGDASGNWSLEVANRILQKRYGRIFYTLFFGVEPVPSEHILVLDIR